MNKEINNYKKEIQQHLDKKKILENELNNQIQKFSFTNLVLEKIKNDKNDEISNIKSNNLDKLLKIQEKHESELKDLKLKNDQEVLSIKNNLYINQINKQENHTNLENDKFNFFKNILPDKNDQFYKSVMEFYTDSSYEEFTKAILEEYNFN